MAKIKTLKFSLNGLEVNLNINCSKDGVFSAQMSGEYAKEIGLDDNKCTSKDLRTVEQYFNNAVEKYNKSKKELHLCIGINFHADGIYTCNEEGDTLEPFITNKELRPKFNNRDNKIEFDYNILLKESFAGTVRYYRTRRYTENESRFYTGLRQLNGYVETGFAFSHGDYVAVIPYSENALNNLLEIENSLRKASLFLAQLVSSDRLNDLLSSTNNLKLIGG